MNNNTTQNNKIQNILEKIHNNELTLKSKTYFRLRFALLIIVIVAIVVVTLFFLSFILFSLRASGQAALIGFGPTGWQVFLALFPWKLTILEIVLILLLEYLLRSFRFGYKVPVLYLLFGVVLLMGLSAIAVDQTPLHRILLEQADQNHLPYPFGSMYENTRRPPPQGYGIYKGTITAIGTSTATIELVNPMGIGTTTQIMVLLPASPLPDAQTIAVGEKVFVRGQLVHGAIRALEIKLAADQLPPAPNTS